MNDIMQYLNVHWVEWIVAVLAGISTFLYQRLKKNIEVTNLKNESVCDGMQALLRSEIIDKYNYYKDKGICPIYAKENIKRLYEPYKSLGGNDVATALVRELLEMPTEKNETDE